MIIRLHKKRTGNYHARFCDAIDSLMNTNAASNAQQSHPISRIYHVYRIAMPSAIVCILIIRPLVMRLVKLTVKN
jgi:hypothetical protein